MTSERKITPAQAVAICEAINFLRTHSGDTWWSSTRAPRGDGRPVRITEIWPTRNNRDYARRRTIRRLDALGVLREFGIECDRQADTLKAMPGEFQNRQIQGEKS